MLSTFLDNLRNLNPIHSFTLYFTQGLTLSDYLLLHIQHISFENYCQRRHTAMLLLYGTQTQGFR